MRCTNVFDGERCVGEVEDHRAARGHADCGAAMCCTVDVKGVPTYHVNPKFRPGPLIGQKVPIRRNLRTRQALIGLAREVRATHEAKIVNARGVEVTDLSDRS